MTDIAWHEALDAYEARLVAQRAALGTADPTVVPFVPPAGLGPLPPALAERARALLADARALEADLAARTDAARDAIGSSSRPTTTPSFIDARF